MRQALSIQYDTSHVKTINLIQRQMINMENLIVDDIGVRPPPLCKSCSGCVNCNNMRLELSRDDQELLKLVKDNMEIDEENHTITASSLSHE